MIGAANRIHSQRSRGLRPELGVLRAVPGSSGTFTAPRGVGGEDTHTPKCPSQCVMIARRGHHATSAQLLAGPPCW